MILKTRRKPWPDFMYSSLFEKWRSGICPEWELKGQEVPHGGCGLISLDVCGMEA